MGTNLRPIRTSRAGTELRLILLSDTHQLHRDVEVPDGDLCIFAGDFTFFSKSMKAVLDFNDWLGELPHRCGFGAHRLPRYLGDHVKSGHT